MRLSLFSTVSCDENEEQEKCQKNSFSFQLQVRKSKLITKIETIQKLNFIYGTNIIDNPIENYPGSNVLMF